MCMFIQTDEHTHDHGCVYMNTHTPCSTPKSSPKPAPNSPSCLAILYVGLKLCAPYLPLLTGSDHSLPYISGNMIKISAALQVRLLVLTLNFRH